MHRRPVSVQNSFTPNSMGKKYDLALCSVVAQCCGGKAWKLAS